MSRLPPNIPLTRAQAKEIRAKQLQGVEVNPMDLYRAIWTLSKRKDRYHLPKLSRETREMANAVLLFNLGKAIKGTA